MEEQVFMVQDLFMNHVPPLRLEEVVVEEEA
jgi:hypothetical protein